MQMLIGKDSVPHVSIENLTNGKSNNFSFSELSNKWLNIHDNILKSFINTLLSLKYKQLLKMNVAFKNKTDIIF